MRGSWVNPLTARQRSQPIKGSAGWIKSERFTIDAKANGPASTEMMQGPMMQAVLKDRFRLAVHQETKDTPVYYLTIGRGGPRFPSSKEESCTVLDPAKAPPAPLKAGQPAPAPLCGGVRRSKDGGVDLYGVPMGHLCLFLSDAMDRDVVDRTGLSGTFDIHLEVPIEQMIPFAVRGGIESQPSDAAAVLSASDPTGSIPTAVRKIGLQLQAGKKLTEFVVIDHVEMPTAN
jgi:uncharacterized protein (TIGR03435 family)